MNIAFTGALVGAGVALSLLSLEYAILRSRSAERAREKHRKDAFDGADRSRIAALARFCIFIPPVFAALFWVVWD